MCRIIKCLFELNIMRACQVTDLSKSLVNFDCFLVSFLHSFCSHIWCHFSVKLSLACMHAWIMHEASLSGALMNLSNGWVALIGWWSGQIRVAIRLGFFSTFITSNNETMANHMKLFYTLASRCSNTFAFDTANVNQLYSAIALLATCPRMQCYRKSHFSALIVGQAGNHRATCEACSGANRWAIHCTTTGVVISYQTFTLSVLDWVVQRGWLFTIYEWMPF
jgi:hypothetical protein